MRRRALFGGLLILVTAGLSYGGSAVHDAGLFEYTISDFGWHGSKMNDIGFKYAGEELLYEGCLMVALTDSIVVVCTHEQYNYIVSAGGQVTIAEPGVSTDANEEGFAIYEDNIFETGHAGPVRITEQTYVWESTKYVLVRYTVENAGGKTLSNIYIGQFQDWDVDVNQCDNNVGNFDSVNLLAYQYNPVAGQCSLYCGVKMLDPIPTSLKFVNNHALLYDWFDEWDEPIFSEWMRSDTFETSTPIIYDWSTLLSTGSFNLAPGEKVIIWIAMAVGDNLSDLQTAIAAATERFNSTAFGVEEENVLRPRAFVLHQNCPNPFYAGTNISFSLPERGRVNIKVYDLMGRVIQEVIDAEMTPGSHLVYWDGKDSSGRGVPSGIYLYKILVHTDLETGDYTQTRKMVLLR